jgi:alpha-1,2-glucosyltransferase
MNMTYHKLFPSYLKDFIKKISHVIILDILFIVFLVKNNYSVVLGDKSNHSLTFHLAQINHLLFFGLFFFPKMNTKIMVIFQKEFYKSKNLFKFFITIILLILFFWINNKFSYTHEFLVSDNRHYSYYYFKKIYLNLFLRWGMILYSSFVYSLIIVENIELIKDSSIISWFICASLILAPSRLFEFRYLAFPYLSLLFFVHYFSPKWKDLHKLLINRFNLVWIIAINIITGVVFINYPFKNSWFNNQLSRFMW